MIEKILKGYNLQIILPKQKKTILNIPEFHLDSGEILALVGPNGAGKSTLIKVLALLSFPSPEGYIEFRGERVTKHQVLSLRRRMAVVFQEPLLLDTTVFENVAVGLKIRGVSAQSIKPRVNEWLERLGIAHLARRSSRYLSGGEAQRVSLARAFVLEPEVLFLDEPFSSLDTPTRVLLIKELKELLLATKVSTVMVSHNYAEVQSLADRVLVMQDGQVINQGKPDSIFTQPLF
ncbi:MAG: energy-coupling factor ABC transporter ATP-binding protein [Bacillota bacterium]|jgi:tungstate transport system ATP-binding protein